jgi:hypothetical protein
MRGFKRTCDNFKEPRYPDDANRDTEWLTNRKYWVRFLLKLQIFQLFPGHDSEKGPRYPGGKKAPFFVAATASTSSGLGAMTGEINSRQLTIVCAKIASQKWMPRNACEKRPTF